MGGKEKYTKEEVAQLFRTLRSTGKRYTYISKSKQRVVTKNYLELLDNHPLEDAVRIALVNTCFGGGGPKYMKFLFNTPLRRMPLLINDSDEMIQRLVKWRLSIGK